MTLSDERLQSLLAPRAVRFYAQAGSTNDRARAWLREAEREVDRLEGRLASLSERILRWEAERGKTVYEAYVSSANGSTRPTDSRVFIVSTRLAPPRDRTPSTRFI